MPISVATTRVALRTTPGTQDITIPGFGTPKAALLLLNQASSAGVATDSDVLSTGLTDGVQHWAGGVVNAHGLSTAFTHKVQDFTACLYKLHGVTGAEEVVAAWSAWIPDGMQLTVTTAPATAYLLTVMLFGGSDLTAYVNYVTASGTLGGTVSTTAPGFAFDDLLMLGLRTSSVSTSGYAMSLGLCHHAHNVLTSRSLGWGRVDAVSPTESGAGVSTTAVAYLSSGASVSAYEITARSATGFTVTTRLTGTATYLPYLALAYNGAAQSWVGTVTTPTSPGAQSYHGPGFLPQAVLLGQSLVPTLDTHTLDADSGTAALSLLTSAAQSCLAQSSVENVSPSNTQSLHADVALVVPQEDGSPGLAATLTSFAATGWTLNYSAVLGTARQGWGWAISAAPPPAEPLWVATTRVALRTTTGTQDILIPGGGTPKAALLLLNHASSDGVAADGDAVGIGLTDGVRQWAMAARDAHNFGDSICARGQRTTHCLYKESPVSSAVEVLGVWNAWLPGGVRIQLTTASTTPYLLTVVLFGGSDLTAYVNSLTAATTLNATTETTDPGFAFDDLVMASSRTTAASDNAAYTMGLGVCHHDSSLLTVRSLGWGRLGQAGTTTVGAGVSTAYLTYLSDGSTVQAHELTARSATGFTVTTRLASGATTLGYLALAYGGTAQSWLGTVATPTATGAQSYNGPGFAPQAVLVGQSVAPTLDTHTVTADGGTAALSVLTPQAQYCLAQSSADNVSTTNTQSLHDDSALIVPQHDGSAGVTATLTRLLAPGWTLDYGAVLSPARQGWAWAIAAPPVTLAHDVVSESHPGTTGSTSQTSFTWNHPSVVTPKGVLVLTFTNATADDATGVTYAGAALTAVAGGRAVDTAGEPGDCKAWFLGTNVPTTTPAPVMVSRNNTVNVMYAVCITVTAAGDTELKGPPVLVQEDGTFAEQAVDSGADVALRYAGANSGLSALIDNPGTPGTSISRGMNSAALIGMDYGTRVVSVVREITPGTGSRPVGFVTTTADDRAAVHVAIGEVAPVGGPTTGTGTATGLSTVTAVGHRRQAALGNSPGVSTVQAAGVGRFRAVASAAGLSTVQAAGARRVQAVGSTTGLSTVHAAGLGRVRAVGSAPGLTAVQAAGTSQHRASGTAAGLTTVQAGGLGRFRVVASAAGLSTVQAVGARQHRVVGSAAGLSTGTAVGLARVRTIGSAAGLASVQAGGTSQHRAVGLGTGLATVQATSAVPVVPATGTSLGSSLVQGAGRAWYHAVGSSTGLTLLQAVGRRRHAADGSSAGSATVQALGLGRAPRAGTSAGLAVGTGVGRSRHLALGSTTGLTTLQAVGRSRHGATGTVTGTASAQAVGAVGVGRTTGTATGLATVLATGRWRQPALGSSAGLSTVQSTGRSRHGAVGTSTGSSVVSGMGGGAGAAFGSSLGTSTGVATSRWRVARAGTSAGLSTVQAVAAWRHRGSGSSLGSTLVQGRGTGRRGALGQSGGLSPVLAVGRSRAAATGTSLGTSLVSATAQAGAGTVGISAGLSTVQAVGQSRHAAAGTSAGTALVQAFGGGTGAGLGLSAGSSLVLGRGQWRHRALGLSTSSSLLQAVGVATHRSVGTALGLTTGTASAVSTHRALGTILGVAAVQAFGAGTGLAFGQSPGLATVHAMSQWRHATVGQSLALATAGAPGQWRQRSAGQVQALTMLTAQAQWQHVAVGTSLATALVAGLGNSTVLFMTIGTVHGPARVSQVIHGPTPDATLIRGPTSAPGTIQGPAGTTTTVRGSSSQSTVR